MSYPGPEQWMCENDSNGEAPTDDRPDGTHPLNDGSRMPDPTAAELASSLTLLCADAIAFTSPLTDEHREILDSALREAAGLQVTEESEEAWFQKMLDAKMTTTAAFGYGRDWLRVVEEKK